MTPLSFLTALFGHPALEHQYLTLWDRQTKRSCSMPCTTTGIARSAAYAEEQSKSFDVYVGTCPYMRPMAMTERGSESDVGALVALWADIDIATEGHHKAHELPKTVDEAMAVIRECGKQASMVIHSGGGLHAWWLLDKPALAAEHSQRGLREITNSWHLHLASIAEKHGWKLDNTSDLARVLRIPGTLNHKGANPKSVIAIP